MESKLILVISDHPLFADAIIHILKNENINVTATARNLKAALPLLEKHQPDTIIVDCNKNCQPDTQMISTLTGDNKSRRVIFLTLTDNRMIVHHWQQLGDATSADLVSAIKESFPHVTSEQTKIQKVDLKDSLH